MELLDRIEVGFAWIGGLEALATLIAIFYGFWRGLQRSAGRAVGQVPGILHKKG